MTQVSLILQALANGADTVADVEADLDFKFSKHHIAGHLSGLKVSGKVVVMGTAVTGAGKVAYRYALTPRGRKAISPEIDSCN